MPDMNINVTATDNASSVLKKIKANALGTAKGIEAAMGEIKFPAIQGMPAGAPSKGSYVNPETITAMNKAFGGMPAGMPRISETMTKAAQVRMESMNKAASQMDMQKSSFELQDWFESSKAYGKGMPPPREPPFGSWNMDWGLPNKDKGGAGGGAINQRKLLMPFLSTMFAAMALQRALQGLITPAQTLAGITEIITTMLELFFLPVMLALLDPLFWLFELFTSLDEQTQMVIGSLVIAALAIAGFVMVVSQLALGFAGLQAILAMLGIGGAAAGGGSAAAVAGIPAIGGGAAGSSGAVAGGTVISGGALLVILAIIGLIILEWDKFAKMVGAVGVLLWEFVGGLFTACGQMIAGILRMVIGVFQIFFGVIVGLFTGNWTMLGEGLKNFFGGIFQVLSAIVTAAWLFIKTVLGLIWEILAGVLGMVIDAFYKIVTWFVDTFMPDMKKPWTDLATWLDTTWNGVVDGILLILKPLTDVLDGIIKKIAEIAKNPVGAIFGEGNPTGSSAGHWEGLPFISKWIAGYAEGGFVPNTGLAMLHAGEYVVPRSGMLVSESGGGGVNTVNVYANVSNDVDMRQLADEIARIWYSDFNRRRV